MKLDKISRML